MSVRYIGPEQKMGPVPIAAATAVQRGDLVRVVSGLVVAVVDAAVAGMAVAMQSHPDTEYEEPGGPGKIDVARLGEDQEVELPFTGRAIAAGDIGNVFNIRSLNGGTVNLSATAAPAFKIVRLSRDTAMGDTDGYVVGVFLDATTF